MPPREGNSLFASLSTLEAEIFWERAPANEAAYTLPEVVQPHRPNATADDVGHCLGANAAGIAAGTADPVDHPEQRRCKPDLCIERRGEHEDIVGKRQAGVPGFRSSGNLLVVNGNGSNADPNQPSEIVEFTTAGQFVSQFSINANKGGAFGIALDPIGIRVCGWLRQTSTGIR